MSSVAVEGSVSVSELSAVFTLARIPDSVSVWVFAPLATELLAFSSPLVSDSTTVKPSPLRALVSDMLRPETPVEVPCTTVAEAGAVIDGSPAVATEMVAGVAFLPVLSLAVTLTLSEPDALSVMVRVERSVCTCDRLPVMARLVVPAPAHPRACGAEYAGRVGEVDREGLARECADLAQTHAEGA